MKFYIHTKVDPKSDDGYFTVVVRATNVIKALIAINRHVHSYGRDDLEVRNTERIEELEVTPNGIVYSNVQSLGD